MNILWYGFGAIAQNRLEKAITKKFIITKNYFIDPNVDIRGLKYEKMSTSMLYSKTFDLCIFSAPWWHRDYSIMQKIKCKHFYIEKPVGDLDDLLSQIMSSAPDIKVVLGYQRSLSDSLSRLKIRLQNFDYDTINIKSTAPLEKKYLGNLSSDKHQYSVLDEVGSHVLSQLCEVVPDLIYCGNFQSDFQAANWHCNGSLRISCVFDIKIGGNIKKVNFFNSHTSYGEDRIVFLNSRSNDYLGYTFIGGDFCFYKKDRVINHFRGKPYSDKESVSKLFDLLLKGDSAPVFNLGVRTEKLITDLKQSIHASNHSTIKRK